jgi:hypothetical protein
MNRKQRRALASKIAKDKKNIGGKTPVWMDNVPEHMGYKEGDTFTIKGIKRLKDGTTIYNCKPGEETIFIAGAPKDEPQRKNP